jgi:glycosyltransferase involved in cell wall biosynthesis
MIALFPDTTQPGTGKGFFLQSLVAKLQSLGVIIITDRAEAHDLVFENIRLKHKSYRPVVVRFDGVYHDTAVDWKAKNEGLRLAAERANAIICQSDFGRRMVIEYLQADPKKITVVLNGFDLNAPVVKPELRHTHNFIAVAVWRPHKRLVEMINAFLLADIPDSILRIFGRLGKGMDEKIKALASDRVVFMDQVVDRSLLLGHMHCATAMLHLCWFDCCPNSVVEAIGQRCPVICSNEGGTHELVEPSNGIALPLDAPYGLHPIDLYHPPAIDINKVAEAMHIIIKEKPPIFNSHVDINRTATLYKKVFESVL